MYVTKNASHACVRWLSLVIFIHLFAVPLCRMLSLLISIAADQQTEEETHIDIIILTDQDGQTEEFGVQHALLGKMQTCLCVHLAHTALCFDQEVECVLLCRS